MYTRKEVTLVNSVKCRQVRVACGCTVQREDGFRVVLCPGVCTDLRSGSEPSFDNILSSADCVLSKWRSVTLMRSPRGPSSSVGPSSLAWL
ncbi:hypothetical protein SKAU_G00083980 [Synaphobranchus kaupii]|uniref:Uncharacterized protein n=1 Tax=Synaphobranchus kaupii TaxID=118154 RepID=A0A9Q1J3K6_SYNKA|nr:hypothetical protein SKAU_G00083980 [Synaphobranchus kaupii]